MLNPPFGFKQYSNRILDGTREEQDERNSRILFQAERERKKEREIFAGRLSSTRFKRGMQLLISRRASVALPARTGSDDYRDRQSHFLISLIPPSLSLSLSLSLQMVRRSSRPFVAPARGAARLVCLRSSCKSFPGTHSYDEHRCAHHFVARGRARNTGQPFPGGVIQKSGPSTPRRLSDLVESRG